MEFIALYPVLRQKYNFQAYDNRYTLLYTIITLVSYLLFFIKQFGFRMFKIKISEYFYQLLPNYLHPIIYIVSAISVLTGLYLLYTKYSRNIANILLVYCLRFIYRLKYFNNK